MPATQIPKELAQGHARVSSEGHRGLHEILVSIQADLLEIKAKFAVHTHAGFAPPPPPPEHFVIGTTVETGPDGPYNLPGTNGV